MFYLNGSRYSYTTVFSATIYIFINRNVVCITRIDTVNFFKYFTLTSLSTRFDLPFISSTFSNEPKNKLNFDTTKTTTSQIFNQMLL